MVTSQFLTTVVDQFLVTHEVIKAEVNDLPVPSKLLHVLLFWS